MDVLRNAAFDGQRSISGLGSQLRGSIGAELTGTGSGGLLDTFDAVFRAVTAAKSSERDSSGRHQNVGSTDDSGRPGSSAGNTDSSADSGRPAELVTASETTSVDRETTERATVGSVAVEDEGASVLRSGEEAVEADLGGEDLDAALAGEAENAVEVEQSDLVDDVDEATDRTALAEQIAATVIAAKQDKELQTDVTTEDVVQEGDQIASRAEAADVGVKLGVTGIESNEPGLADGTLHARAVDAGAGSEAEVEDAVSKAGSVAEDVGRLKERGRRVGAKYSSERADQLEFVSDESAEKAVIENQEVTGEQRELLLKLRQLEAAGKLEQTSPSASDSLASTPGATEFSEQALPTSSGLERVLSGALARQASTQSQATNAEPASDSNVGTVDGSGRREDGLHKLGGQSKTSESNTNEMQVRLVQRVARAFQRLGPDGGRVNIMLHPAELGSLKLELKIDGQAVNARMIAESETAMSVLRESLPELKQKLIESGLVVEKIEVELAGQESGTGQGESGRGFQFGQEDRSREGRANQDWNGRGSVRRTAVDSSLAEKYGQISAKPGQISARRTLDLKL